MTIGLLPFVVVSVNTVTQHVLTHGGQSKTDLRHLRMCCVRTRSKREASSQNLTRKTSHILNIHCNFLNGFELISKMTRGTSESAEIPCLCWAGIAQSTVCWAGIAQSTVSWDGRASQQCVGPE